MYDRQSDWETEWPLCQSYQTLKELPYQTSKDGPIVRCNFVRPFSARQLYRTASPGHRPGESYNDRVRALMAGKEAPKVPSDKLLYFDTKSEIWLAFQLLHGSTRTPTFVKEYFVVNWARFFLVKADRTSSVADATVATRIDWSKIKMKVHKTGGHCTQLTLPLRYDEDALDEG